MITPERLKELRDHYAPAVTVDYACAAIVELLDEVEGLTASRNYGRDIINDMSLEAADYEKTIEKLQKEVYRLTDETLAQQRQIDKDYKGYRFS